MLLPRADQRAVRIDGLPILPVFACQDFPTEKPIAKFVAQRALLRGVRDAVCLKSQSVNLGAALSCSLEVVNRQTKRFVVFVRIPSEAHGQCRVGYHPRANLWMIKQG